MNVHPSLISILVLLLVVGCQQQSVDQPAPAAGNASHDHEHDHGHDHAHTGPHGGHILELGREDYHAEWTHKDQSSEIVVHLLDADIKQDVSTTAELIMISTTIRGEQQTYELAADNQDESDPPRATRFTITSPSLLTALKQVGAGVQADISVIIDGKMFRGSFEKNEHDH